MQIEALMNQIQILAQAGGIDPMAAQAANHAQVQMEMQKPEELEKLVTIEQVRILTEVIPQLLPAGQRPDVRPAGADPHAGAEHQAARPAAQGHG
jgi:hypothetical protein